MFGIFKRKVAPHNTFEELNSFFKNLFSSRFLLVETQDLNCYDLYITPVEGVVVDIALVLNKPISEYSAESLFKEITRKCNINYDNPNYGEKVFLDIMQEIEKKVIVGKEKKLLEKVLCVKTTLTTETKTRKI